VRRSRKEVEKREGEEMKRRKGRDQKAERITER